MIYLAQPYSHPDRNVRDRRFEQGTNYAMELFQRGKFVFSPILHWHHASILHSTPFTADHWARYNNYMLSRASALYAILLEGWEQSKGLRAEALQAHHQGTPVYTNDGTGWKLRSSRTFLEEFEIGTDIIQLGTDPGTAIDPLGR